MTNYFDIFEMLTYKKKTLLVFETEKEVFPITFNDLEYLICYSEIFSVRLIYWNKSNLIYFLGNIYVYKTNFRHFPIIIRFEAQGERMIINAFILKFPVNRISRTFQQTHRAFPWLLLFTAVWACRSSMIYVTYNCCVLLTKIRLKIRISDIFSLFLDSFMYISPSNIQQLYSIPQINIKSNYQNHYEQLFLIDMLILDMLDFQYKVVHGILYPLICSWNVPFIIKYAVFQSFEMEECYIEIDKVVISNDGIQIDFIK